MMRRCSLVMLLLFLPPSVSATLYHQSIQAGRAEPLPPVEFERLEAEALEHFDRAEPYEPLVRVFAGTSEPIWVLVYGEIFANLTGQEDRRLVMGARVFETYDRAIQVGPDSTRITLTQQTRLQDGALPFENRFEILLLLGLGGVTEPLEPLSIGVLARARRTLLRLWREQGLPMNEWFRRLVAVDEAGHWDAYHHWLFQTARPQEYLGWHAGHAEAYDAWLAWLARHPFRPERPDFHRIAERAKPSVKDGTEAAAEAVKTPR